MTNPLDTPQTFNADALLNWYDRAGRALPWRERENGRLPAPYKVWLSEIMLQQTGVSTVLDYYRKFLAKWPTLGDLARADLDEILENWAGLGYYHRAKNLHKAAQALHNAPAFPSTPAELLKYPGIGAYTASAIAAISFNAPIIPSDGNVERITARFFALENPLPAAKKFIDAQAQRLNERKIAKERASDFTQALFDLGATVCTPRNPKCDQCPVAENCRARILNIAETLPRNTPKKAKKNLYAVSFVLSDKAANEIFYLKKRGSTGLLPDMWEVPTSEWTENPIDKDDALKSAFSDVERAALEKTTWRKRKSVTHVFTHIKLHVDIHYARLPKTFESFVKKNEIALGDLETNASSSLMKKIVKSANLDTQAELFTD